MIKYFLALVAAVIVSFNTFDYLSAKIIESIQRQLGWQVNDN
jgi:hypothetical protein